MIGEREVSNFNSVTGRKVRLAYRRAQNFVGILHQWRHLRASTTTLSTAWVGGTVTLPPFTEVYRATYKPSTLLAYPLRSINPDTLRRKDAVAMLQGIPEFYAIVGENRVQFYPTPTLQMRTEIELDLLLRPTIASQPGDILEGVDSYVDLVTLYAQVVMHRVHTTDLNAAEATAREFETSVHMYRTANVLQSVSYL